MRNTRMIRDIGASFRQNYEKAGKSPNDLPAFCFCMLISEGFSFLHEDKRLYAGWLDVVRKDRKWHCPY